MRIYFIGSKGLPVGAMPGAGGVETHVAEIATHLATRGHDIFVYTRRYPGETERPLYKHIHLIYLPFFPSTSLATISHVFFATIHVLFQKADIIHYHGVGPATFAWIPRLLKPKTKIVVTFHSLDRLDPKWSWLGRAYLHFGEWAALNYPHKTIIVSHVLQRYCRKHYHRSPLYIPNGADIYPRPPVATLRKFHVKPGKFFLCVGRLVPNKAVEVAIRAMKRIKTTYALVIAGNTEHAVKYVQTVKRIAKRDPRIRLLGHQTDIDLHALYAYSYVFIHPSRTEGLSTAILEAMSFGKPVIMSNIKENLELIDHQGIAFHVDDDQDLAHAMEWALAHPEEVKKRGARAQSTIKQFFTWESIADRTLAVYTSLTSK